MAASNQLPVSLQFGSLLPNVRWTPQQLGDAIAARLSLVTSQSFALFVSGSTAPSSNVGPWLKNGREWYVWDVVSGSYIPQVLNQASLGYFIGNAAPDHNQYQIWISTTPAGQPLAVNTWYSGAWTDVYAAVIGDYMTTAAFNAAIANYYTQAQTNAAIATAVGGLTTTVYEFRAYKSAATQIVSSGAGITQVVFDGISFNPDGAFAANVFTAPVAGKYFFKATIHISIASGTPTLIERNVYLRVGGSIVSWQKAQLNDLNGAQSITVSDQLDLAQGAVVDVAVMVSSTGSSTWNLENTTSDCNFSGWLVKTP
jgi:hypothetical protein